MTKKASIQLPTSAMIWIILGVLMFSMTFIMFKDMFKFEKNEFEDFDEFNYDLNYLDVGQSKSELFALKFYEGMLVFFEHGEDIKVTTDPKYTVQDFLSKDVFTGKKPQTYVFSPSEECYNQPCLCKFKEIDYTTNPRVSKKKYCKVLPKTFIHPKTNDYNALVVVPAYNFGLQKTADDETSHIRNYNFETNATGDIFIIDRWTFFQPYERTKQGALKVIGIVAFGAVATVATGGLAAGPIIATIGMSVATATTAAVAGIVAGDELGGSNTNQENVIDDAEYGFYEGGMLAEPIVKNRVDAEKNMLSYAYLDKTGFYISLVDDSHFVVCLFPDYCESQIHALKQDQSVISS